MSTRRLGQTSVSLMETTGENSHLPTQDQPIDHCIHELFEAQVERTPDAIALMCEGVGLTYRELNGRANYLAQRLQSLGVGHETVVGLYMERSLGMVIGLLGILKAGGAYVPLDSAYPDERLAFILQDAAVSVVVTRRHLAPRVGSCAAAVLCLEPHEPATSQEVAANPSSSSTPESLAYVIYTSGSSGSPKGVLGSHQGIVNCLAAAWDMYPFARDEVCCHKITLSFIDATWELLLPLLRGIKTVIIPDGVLKDPRRLVEALATARVTRILLIPSLLHSMLETYPDLHTRLPRLGLWMCGGEAMPAELCHTFLQRMPGCRLLNGYGSTEVAACATCYDASLGTSLATVPIGQPIARTQVYILDEQQQHVAEGAVGEICVGGMGLARGYLNRPELTAERFITLNRGGSGERLYRTGDLGRFLPDGNVEYLGRMDLQVKVRGVRIALEEIEATLMRHPGVSSAVVASREGRAGMQRLVAYIVPAKGYTPRLGEVRQFVKDRLPEHMVPATVMCLDAFPLTLTGKVDRQTLPAPDQGRPLDRDTLIEPQTPLHNRLAELWADILSVSPIGITDSFFDLGGDSLLAVELLNRVEETFQSRIELATLFSDPTIVHLSRVLERAGSVLESTAPAEPGAGLWRLRAEGSQTPLFYVHGDYYLGGFYCYEFVEYLDADRPFYVLPQHGTDGREVPPTIEEIAADHVALVRACRPHGPYALGGLCNGGMIAFEMARQLRTAGEEIAGLIVIGMAPDDVRLDDFASAIAQCEPIEAAYLRALSRYVPRPYDRRVTLLWPVEEPRPCPDDCTLGWAKVAADVAVHTIPGTHASYMGEYVSDTVARVNAGLADGRAE